MTNKVHLTIRLDPKLLAYIKQQAPDNMSRFVEELVRKHAADNVQDDTLARLKRAIISDNDFLDAVASKIGAPTAYPPVIQNLADTDPQDNWNKRYDKARPFWSPFGPLPLIQDPAVPAVYDPNVDEEVRIPLDVDKRNAWLERE